MVKSNALNRIIVVGIKRILYGYRPRWIDQVAHVLWAIRTQKKTGSTEAPFSIIYGTKAMVPVEIGLTLPRVLAAGEDNDKQRRIDLMLLEKRRELAAMREQNYKRELQKY
ncbi:uncharacterized protein LOC143631238 [Bidens hawaiensis]|uniref:uncharacterized protein LOC143631238 n=1 Tax=Bidens hawaiensis TaxID=980011 RepID=UPI00404ACCC0